MRFSRYFPASSEKPGSIDCVGYCHPSQIDVQKVEGMGFWSGEDKVDLDLDYFDLTRDPPEPKRRPTLTGFDKQAIAADDTDAATLHLPEPFTAEIDGTEYRIDEPNAAGVYELAITSAMPATYKVAIRHFPFLDFETEITAS